MPEEKHPDSLLASPDMRAGLLSDMEDDGDDLLPVKKQARMAQSARRRWYYVLVCAIILLALGVFGAAVIQVGIKLRGQVDAGGERHATESSQWPVGVHLSSTGVPLNCGASGAEAIAN